MSTQDLLVGPHLSELEAAAFERVKSEIGDQPNSIIYLSQRVRSDTTTRQRWSQYGSTACLRIETFDRLVTTCYERDQYKGEVTHIDQPLLYRLVEAGIEQLETSNPFSADGQLPRAGLVQEAEQLYTALERGGLLSADAMETRLSELGLSDRANAVAALATAIEEVRDSMLADELPETYQTERMHQLTTTTTPLEELLPAVDAVVVGGFTRFDALERQLLERITETWPTVALLPSQHEGGEPAGVDAGAQPAAETYNALGFTPTPISTDARPAIANRRRVTQNLYRHPDESPPVADIDPAALALTITDSETLPTEVRAAAREIRQRLAAGTDPETIGVVLTNSAEYSDTVREVFDAYEIPFVLQTEQPLAETAIGTAVEAVCQLATEPRSVETLLDLLTNPLVTATDTEGTVDHHSLARVASRTDTIALAPVIEHLDAETTAGIEALIADVDAVAQSPLADLPTRLTTLLDQLGITTSLSDATDNADLNLDQEMRAADRLNRISETLAMTAGVADHDQGTVMERLERAITYGAVRAPAAAEEHSVVVCGLSDADAREWDYVYVLGMTAAHLPSDPEHMAFTQPIYDAHRDFAQQDTSLEARYHLGTLLRSGATLRLSAPQRTLGGEPHVQPDLLTELRRVIDYEAITTTPEETPGTREDVQTAISTAVTAGDESRPQPHIDAAVAAGTFSEAIGDRMHAGAACAAARADPERLSAYDGQLSPEMVAQLHPETAREPYSASRLETYAACGYKYYMQRVLEIGAPEPLTREPHAGLRGSYIHDVLEHYYRTVQSDVGEPVDPGGDFQTRQATLLTVARDRLADAFAGYAATAFQEEWLTGVLAGLDTPAENPYYGPTATKDGEPVAKGLLYRFLEHEFAEPAKTTARPTWLEARIGDPHPGGTPVGDGPASIQTPTGEIQLHGLVDRVDTVRGTSPTQAVVRDYKTGSAIPSASDALLGLQFQLPLYALMIEAALPELETVGAAYYQISPPTAVSSRRGLVTSQEMAVYHGDDEVSTPLLRHSYPHFETHTAFRRFLTEKTPARLGELTAGIAGGQFQPTLLEPADAGCRHCDYAQVCDVRHHQRQETIETIDTEGIPAYVPPAARGLSPGDVVEVN
ncbi:PD-(D/E)XK nuclease family protein [Halorubrum salsamenti]|uniref:PD-(D/E)XK nuclease family protein n=1 Tax=Halorubrum salsamenti TaxID=2583990 RepID=UPI0011A2B92C|nr:PD-(D/E)XK nuclease family protein [Halorubrum salsamenti]